MLKKFLFILLPMLFSSNLFPDSQFGHNNCIKEGFLPKNELYIPVHSKGIKSGINESDFNTVLDKVEKLYAPIMRNYNGQLIIERKWQDGTVNASALRRGSQYIVTMYGGLARHHTITRDAFALVACHEIGHHIGGVPRYQNAGQTWASVEGQSDYFATSKCLRKLFEFDDNESILSGVSVDPTIIQKCEQEFTGYADQLVCKRIGMASISSAALFASSRNIPTPRVDTPDPTIVNRTDESHPGPQCRLDTYFNGAVCSIDKDSEIGQNDPHVGTCNRSDTHQEGLRPQCWYKPLIGGGPNPTPPPVPTPDPGPTPNPPSSGIADTPHVNGAISISTKNPNTSIPISFDVSRFQNVYGLAIEISKPNHRFSNPNGTDTDPNNSIGAMAFTKTQGVYNFVPYNELPGYGRYQIRVIGLDKNKAAVSRFSDNFELYLER